MKTLQQLNEEYIEFMKAPPAWSDSKKAKVRYVSQWEELSKKFVREPRRDISNMPMSKIWTWSDQHFFHKNIIRYSDRPFNDLDEMNQALVDNYKARVQPDDVCIWGGDVGFAPDEAINEILHQCPGYKILIIGNHDFRRKKLRKLHFDEIHVAYDYTLYDTQLVFTHYPFDTVEYPIVNIHGHSHTFNSEHPLCINVSVEQIDYVPITFEELAEKVKTRLISEEYI